MTKRRRRWAGTRPPDNPHNHNIGYLYSALNATTEKVLRKVGNNADTAPFKPFAESTVAAWKEINSCPLSSLRDIGDLVEKYRLLLDDAIDSIRSENMNEALVLNQKMDDLLNQLKQPARTIAGGSYDVHQSFQPSLVDPNSETNSMFAGANSVSIYNCTFNNIAGQTDAVEAINQCMRILYMQVVVLFG